MVNKIGLNFHQTFGPERRHLSRLLSLAEGMGNMTKEQISSKTGIPTGASSGKVVPHLFYAALMGWVILERVRSGYCLTRTPLGQMIYENDPYLLDHISLFSGHYFLCTPPQGAALWRLVFSQVVPTLRHRVDEDTILLAATSEFGRKSINLSPFKTCYTKQTCFGDLQLISVNGSTWLFNPPPYRSELRYVYGYSLLKTWEQILDKRSEITVQELRSILHWDKPYLWEIESMLDVLDALQDLGMILVNRQLKPVTITRRVSSAEVLSRLYELAI